MDRVLVRKLWQKYMQNTVTYLVLEKTVFGTNINWFIKSTSYVCTADSNVDDTVVFLYNVQWNTT